MDGGQQQTKKKSEHTWQPHAWRGGKGIATGGAGGGGKGTAKGAGHGASVGGGGPQGGGSPQGALVGAGVEGVQPLGELLELALHLGHAAHGHGKDNK